MFCLRISMGSCCLRLDYCYGWAVKMLGVQHRYMSDRISALLLTSPCVCVLFAVHVYFRTCFRPTLVYAIDAGPIWMSRYCRRVDNSNQVTSSSKTISSWRSKHHRNVVHGTNHISTITDNFVFCLRNTQIAKKRLKCATVPDNCRRILICLFFLF